MNKKELSRVHRISRTLIKRWENSGSVYDELARRGIAIDERDAVYLPEIDDLFLVLYNNRKLLRKIFFHPEFPIFPLPVRVARDGKILKFPKGVYYNGKKWQGIPWIRLPRTDSSESLGGSQRAEQSPFDFEEEDRLDGESGSFDSPGYEVGD